ncbi:hypothetical protein QJS66_22035 [Kocuria rhizophila]|nr:hypothetical protein QJS66_22035 [Kocuria rhizophila]
MGLRASYAHPSSRPVAGDGGGGSAQSAPVAGLVPDHEVPAAWKGHHHGGGRHGDPGVARPPRTEARRRTAPAARCRLMVGRGLQQPSGAGAGTRGRRGPGLRGAAAGPGDLHGLRPDDDRPRSAGMGRRAVHDDGLTEAATERHIDPQRQARWAVLRRHGRAATHTGDRFGASSRRVLWNLDTMGATTYNTRGARRWLSRGGTDPRTGSRRTSRRRCW